MIWSGEVRAVQSPFPTRTIEIGGVAISIQDIGTIGVVFATVVALWLLFQYTKIGLAMRAAAVNPAEARLVGVRVTWMLSLGWGSPPCSARSRGCSRRRASSSTRTSWPRC